MEANTKLFKVTVQKERAEFLQLTKMQQNCSNFFTKTKNFHLWL